MKPTPVQVKATLEVLRVLADTIRQLGQIPSGHLYARVMEHMTLEQYNTFLSVLISSGVVREENYMLFWNTKGTDRV